jgi:hypothetical protein
MTRRRYQFSVRAFLGFMTACTIAVVAVVRIPHVVVFILSVASVILASRAAYRTVRRSRPRLRLLLASIVAWTALYTLSMGPFIALSEFEKKISGRYNVGRLRNVYRPAMLGYLSWRPFRWYVNKWIPSDATGLHVTNQVNRLQPLVGTWKGELGNLLNLRPNGTARSRLSSGTEIEYFEWTHDSNEFVIYQYLSKRSATAWFGHGWLNYAPTDRTRVVDISATQFRLRDTGGKTYLFTRTQDTELELAP